jgi:hypothetical protein
MNDLTLTTRLHSGQGLGNQLWVYAAVRSICEKLQCNFVLEDLDQFKGKAFLDIDAHVHHGDSNLKSAIHELSTYYEKRYFDKQMKLFTTSFDENVLKIDRSSRLEGYFQSEQYFFGDLEKLRQYMRLSASLISKHALDADICVLNIRGGEYKRFKDLILPKSYWLQAMDHMRNHFGVEKFIVVTDDSPYARYLFPKLEVVSGDVGTCYASLYNAKNVVVSNSSFAYFPIKTGLQSPNVIAPQYWARPENSYQRWANPANLYQDWLWQTQDGGLLTYSDCLPQIAQTENFYQENGYVPCSPEEIIGTRSLREWIPRPIRTQVKKILSKVFPGSIG